MVTVRRVLSPHFQNARTRNGELRSNPAARRRKKKKRNMGSDLKRRVTARRDAAPEKGKGRPPRVQMCALSRLA